MNEERGKGEESLDESHRVAQILEQEDKTDQEGPKKKKNAARTDKGLWFEQPLLLTVGHKPSTISL